MKEFFAGNLDQNKAFVNAFFEHPLVQALSKGEKGRPSYLRTEALTFCPVSRRISAASCDVALLSTTMFSRLFSLLKVPPLLGKAIAESDIT
jgi:hypothetical protein